MTFEEHLRSVSRAASQRLGILRKSFRVFRDTPLLGRCFRGFVLPVREYCSAVWCSAVLQSGARTGGFQEQGQCFFIGLSCSIPTIVFYFFPLSLLSVYRLVLRGSGLRSDRVYVYHSLSALHCRPF